MPRAVPCRAFLCRCRAKALLCCTLVVPCRAEDLSCRAMPWLAVPSCPVPCRATSRLASSFYVSCHVFAGPCLCCAGPCHAMHDASSWASHPSQGAHPLHVTSITAQASHHSQALHLSQVPLSVPCPGFIEGPTPIKGPHHVRMIS